MKVIDRDTQQAGRYVEVRDSGSVHVQMFYPNIYPAKGSLPRVSVGLSHVRSANTVTIEFDGDRDGWVIRMDKTRDLDGVAEVIEKRNCTLLDLTSRLRYGTLY